MIDFRTEKERIRAERDKKICSRYGELRMQADAKPNRIYRLLGEEFKMTPAGILRILKKYRVLFTPESAN